MHIIFDFDGTMADSRDFIIEIYNSIAKAHGKPHVSPDAFVRMSAMSIFERLKLFNVSMLEVGILYREIEKKYFARADELKLFEGIPELISKLAETNYLYVMSSNSRRIISRVLTGNSLLKYFKGLYTNRNILGKAGSIKKILKANLSEGEVAVYIGDEERDILASKKAKITVIAAGWGFDSRSLLEASAPEYIADNPAEVAEIVGRISSK